MRHTARNSILTKSTTDLGMRNSKNDPFSRTHSKPFMSLDFSQFTKPMEELPPPEILPEAASPAKDKKKDPQIEDEIIKKAKEIKDNNALFDQSTTESAISEVNDPLYLTGYKSEDFLNTKMRQYNIDSKCFELEKSPRPKNIVFAKTRFQDAKISDPGQQWREDRDQRIKVNGVYMNQQNVCDQKELKMLKKRHHAHQLKNNVIIEEVKQYDKKLINKYRKLIF